MKIVYWLLVFLPAFLSASFPIIGDGETKITYLDEKKQEQHTITCYQQVELDFNFNYIQCLIPSHDLGKQIHFHDALHDLYSDHLRATYKAKAGTIELDQLKIYGHVCLIQREKPDEMFAFDEMQYALADQLEYDYALQKMKLKARENAQVLYYDPVQNYRIAANEVMMNMLNDSKKPYVEGIGQVRFTFDEDELNRFKTHFTGN